RVAAAGGEGDGGRHVEVGVGEGGDHPAPVERPGQPHHGDLVVPVLDHEQAPPGQQHAVAVEQAGPAEVDFAGHAAAGVDPEQLAGIGLDRQQHPAAPGGDDPVEVVALAVDQVAGQGQGADPGQGGQAAVVAGGQGGELGGRVVDERLAGGPAGHEQAVAPVDLDADGAA